MNPFDMFHEEPLLDQTFAARVLDRVDVQLLRRRQRRVTAAGFAIGCIVAAGVVIGVRAPSGTESTPQASKALAFAQLDNRALARQADALGYMFPDAAPLANFDNTYFVADSAGGDILSADAADSDPG